MTEEQKPGHRGWEYAKKGDYHRNLDPNWSYTPTYLAKMGFVRSFLETLPRQARILDAGCGEGVLVEEFRSQGLPIEGLDLNYESDYVRRGNILDLPYEAGSFEIILLLDVFEHLAFSDQPQALKEIRRVLATGGRLLASIPNLAHWNSRVRLFLFGDLDRTDIEINHPGERPYAENRRLLEKAGFEIVGIKGVTLTVPYIYRQVICRRPAKWCWLHDLLEPLAVNSLAMINIFECRKG